MSDITITLCNPQNGQSESIPVADTMTIGEVIEFSKALLGMSGNLVVAKDGKPLVLTSQSLAQVGVSNGDLLVVMPAPAPARRARNPAPSPAAVTTGGLDFSNLLGSTTSTAASVPPPGAGGLNFSNLLGGTNVNNNNSATLFFQGMNLQDAIEANPHPKAIIKLLLEEENLFKELNHRNPVLAQRIKGLSYDQAEKVWREHIVKGSIKSSFAISKHMNQEREMTRRLRENPDDTEAKEYFEKKKKKLIVDEQYHQVMQEYPESMGKVLMLYIDAKINDNPIQAFVDSGAQSTIMSKKCAKACGIFDLVDTRFAGVAMGVGTGKILGRIHMVQLQIGHVRFPCSVTVMDDATMPMAGGDKDKATPQDMDFLLGLDMLKRHTCSIDLAQGKLKFRLSHNEYLETPFLHEKDLDESKGGTKGFDAHKANEELLKAQQKYDNEDSNEMEE